MKMMISDGWSALWDGGANRSRAWAQPMNEYSGRPSIFDIERWMDENIKVTCLEERLRLRGYLLESPVQSPPESRPASDDEEQHRPRRRHLWGGTI